MGTELCSRSGAAPLSLGLGLGILGWGKKKREVSVFGAGMEAGLSARPALQLCCGRAPGFSLCPCELVHLLFCAASAAMSVVILHLDFGKLCAGLRGHPPLLPDS